MPEREQPIETQAASLAEAGDWRKLYELLKDHPHEFLAANERLSYVYAQALYYTNHYPELTEFAPTFEAAAKRSSHILGLMRAINLAGAAAWELGFTTDATSKFDALLELATAEGHQDMRANALNNLGTLASLRGEHQEALGYYRRCIALYEALDNDRGVARTMYNQGLTCSDLGRFEQAIAHFDHSAALAESCKHHQLPPMIRTARAELEVRRGDLQLAWTLANRALEQTRKVGDDIVSEGEALRVRGIANQHDPDAAIHDLETALRLAIEAGETLLDAKCERDLGIVKARLGRTEEACSHLERAITLFLKIGARDLAQAANEILTALRNGAA